MEEKDLIDRLIHEWKNERPELDTAAMHVVGRILQLGKAMEKQAGDSLKKSKIYYTDLDVLATLRRSGKPYLLSPKQLMGSVLITSGAMTALLDRLEKMKLIDRVADLKDGRSRLARLTNKGVKTIDKAIEIRFNVARDSVSALNKKEQKELASLLRKLVLGSST